MLHEPDVVMVAALVLTRIGLWRYREHSIVLDDRDLLLDRLVLLLPPPIVLNPLYMGHLGNHPSLHRSQLLRELFLLLHDLNPISASHRLAFVDHVLLFFPSLLSWFHSEYELSSVSEFLLFGLVLVNPIPLLLPWLFDEVLLFDFDRWLEQASSLTAFVDVLDLHEYVVVESDVSVALLLHSLELLFGQRDDLLLVVGLRLNLRDHELRLVLVYERREHFEVALVVVHVDYLGLLQSHETRAWIRLQTVMPSRPARPLLRSLPQVRFDAQLGSAAAAFAGGGSPRRRRRRWQHRPRRRRRQRRRRRRQRRLSKRVTLLVLAHELPPSELLLVLQIEVVLAAVVVVAHEVLDVAALAEAG